MSRQGMKDVREIEMRRQAGLWGRGTVLWGTLTLCVAPGRAAEGTPAAPAVSGVDVLGQVALSLILVVTLLLALAWALRRLNRLQPQGAASLRLVGGLSVGVRERIVLVEADDKRLLVGVSPGGLRTLLVLEGHARADDRGDHQGFAGAQGAPMAPPGRAV